MDQTPYTTALRWHRSGSIEADKPAGGLANCRLSGSCRLHEQSASRAVDEDPDQARRCLQMSEVHAPEMCLISLRDDLRVSAVLHEKTE